MVVSETEQRLDNLMLHFIELEIELHRELLDHFRLSGDEKRIFAAETCLYELELLQAYAKHVPRLSGGDTSGKH